MKTGKINAGNNEFLKRYNRTCILNLVRKFGPVSRIKLSELSGLSPTATGSIVTALHKKGYLYEVGSGKSSGGRKPVLLGLKPGTYFSIGIDIEISHMLVILLDFTGKIAEESVFLIDGKEKPSTVFRTLEDKVCGIIKRHNINREKLLGIGISVPGLVDADGKILFAPNLGWRNVDTSGLFASFRDMPIHVENESKASAICENWLGECKGIDNFICINIGSGVGAGIFTGGKLYRGHNGTAGEAGHIIVDENGPLCGCGNRGCLETLVSASALIDRFNKAREQGNYIAREKGNHKAGEKGNHKAEEKGDHKINGKEDNNITLDELAGFAEKGDETALELLFESARYLGIAISNLVNILNPDKVVIGRDFTRYAHLVMEQILQIVQDKALEVPSSHVRIAASSLGDRSSALGAAIIPVKILFGENQSFGGNQ
jgi:N-acetylglucosamine repressor